ncbi:MAG TPA: MazG nucleotide pyrophosphohydrolase domain-containing protein [Candidatus Mcinerneyibacteriales bacterium]|nr:MazG nucleotide pyrophosphohydrolase domain-containing protein [Candidatus Mcinerneyibacteriales bacterium]
MNGEKDSSLKDEWTRALSIQHKAREQGFDWPHVSGVLNKIAEEVDEIRCELEKGDPAGVSVEYGDLLFSVIKLARFIPLDPAVCLSLTNEKFSARLHAIFRRAEDEGIPFSSLTLEEMSRWWEEAKINEPAKKDLQKLF